MPPSGEGTKGRSRGELPQPLTPPECTLSGYPALLIDIPRLRQSDFDSTENDAAWRAGVNLWFSAWESTPAGSLRGDDAALAKAAGMGRDIQSWLSVKSDAMKGFVSCSDGRVYHRTLSEVALGVWIDKLVRRDAGQRGNRGAKSAEARQDELRTIALQIATAATCLRALCPTAPALAKATKFVDAAQSEPQCGRDGRSLPPQRHHKEGAEVIHLDAGAVR